MARKPMKIILVLLTLVIAAGLVWGGLYVYQRGLEREDLKDKAERALREKRHDDAIALARQALAAEPGLLAPSAVLLQALLDADRLDEARAEAEGMLKNPHLKAMASETLCLIALQQNRLEDAERTARSMVATSPGYAYRVLSLIEDVKGLGSNDWQSRLEAAAIRRSLVAVSESDADRAEAFLFSAQVNLEVAPFLTSAEGLLTRAREDLRRAVEAASRARQKDTSYRYELVMGLIRVLSDREDDAEAGARTLRGYTQGIDRSEQAIAELAKYHLRRGEPTEAIRLIRELKDPYLWGRVFWILRQGKHREVALGVLDSGPIRDSRERDVLRGDLLLQSEDEAERARGRDLLAAVASDAEARTPQVLRALLFLALRVDLETARKIAEMPSVQERKDHRITAFLASLLSATEEDKERGLEMARELAQGVATAAEGGEVLGMLSGAGGEAMARFLDAQVEKGGEAGFQARLQRAVMELAKSRREGTVDDSASRARVVEDLKRLLTDAAATKMALLVAFNMAAGLEETELAGRLLARALTMEGAPEMLDARLLTLVRGLKDPAVGQGLAAGVRAAAAESSAPAYLECLAGELETGVPDRAAFQARLLEIASAEPASRARATNLAARIAFGQEDFVEAERLARQVLESDGGNASALETLGASLLKQGKPADVLALYERLENVPEIGHFQVVGALMEMGDLDKALERAQQLVDTYPGSALIHMLLAQIHLQKGNKQAALGVLSVAPATSYVLHGRAELLRDLGDFGLAEQIYEVLLRSSGFRDERAWEGLANVLSLGKRTIEFIEKSGLVLRGGPLDEHPQVRGLVRCLRGFALEREGRVEEALVEYEEALRADAGNWRALNNAAWQIARVVPSRAEQARGYIDRAMDLRKDDPSLLDTAAEVYAVLKDGDKAIAFIDRALALAPEEKLPSYTLHRGRILLELGREKEALVVFRKVRAEYADTPAAGTARDLIWEIERKSMPDRPKDEIVLPPEDEDAGDSDG